MNDQKIENLTLAELNWVNENVQLAKKLILDHTNEASLTVAQLDKAYSGWYKTRQQTKEDPNQMINVFGIAFGSLLIEDLNLEWRVVTDEYGTEIALYGNPGNIIIFPTNLVAKRFEQGITNFFTGLLENLKRDIGNIRKKQ